MNRLIRIALIAGFTVLFERAVRRQLDDRQQQRAIAKAVRNGFATDARQAFFAGGWSGTACCPGAICRARFYQDAFWLNALTVQPEA